MASGMLQKCGRANLGYSLVVCMLVLLSCGAAGTVSMTVSVSNTQINTAADYSFQINRQFNPTNGSYIASPPAATLNSRIVITFPKEFHTLANSPTLPCFNTATGVALTCQVSTGLRQVTITDYYATTSTLSNSQPSVTIKEVINGYKVGLSENFYWEIQYPNGTAIDVGPPVANTYLITGIEFTPGVFKTFTISASGAVVSSFSPITLTVEPSNSIPATGKIVLTFPVTWSSDPSNTAIMDSTPSCVGSGAVSATLVCSSSQSVTERYVTISSLSSSEITGPFTIVVSNIILPPTVGSAESVAVYSQWSDGTQIDTGSSSIAGLTASAFQSATFSSSDNTQVQSKFSGVLTLKLLKTFFYQDTIVLTLPSEFSQATFSYGSLIYFVTTPNLNSTTLSNFPSNPNTIAVGSTISLPLGSLTNPVSTAPITLSVAFYRSSQLYQTATISYAATAAAVSSLSISADSNFVHANGPASLTVLSTLAIPAGATLTLTYPSSILAADQSATALTLCSLNGTSVSTSTFEVTGNQIVFRGVFNSLFTGGTIFLKINSFLNPPTVQPSTYTLAIRDQDTYAIMSGSASFTANTRPLQSNSISASSLKVLDTGVTYTLSFTCSHEFSTVSIILPSDITITTGFESTCAPNSFSSCSLSGSNLTFVGTQTSGSYQLSWGYTTNPNSYQPIASFRVFTYLNGWGVENSQGVISLAMNEQAAFRSFILFPSAYVNNAVISVTLTLGVPTNAPAGQLAVTFPNQLGISSASCTGCTVIPPSILFSVAANSSSLTVVVANIKNVGSFKPITSFTASLSSSAGYSSLFSSVVGWTNDVSSSLSAIVSGDNNYWSESNNFRFIISSLTAAQSYVLISVDGSFTNLAAPAGGSIVDSSKVKASCSGTSCSVLFSMNNPTGTNKYSFAISTFTSEDYQVGSGTSNQWGPDCSTTNCRSCLANSSCLTCYSSTLSSYSIFNTSSSDCVRACSAGFFYVNATTCSVCDANCSQCTTTARTCTSCRSGYFLEPTYKLCVPSCLAGYYANTLSLSCALCTSPCATCSSSSTTCLTCTAGNYLLGTVCSSTCPTGFYVANTVTLQCDACTNQCLTCGTTTSQCLTCNNTLGLYLQGTSCVTTCNSNYFVVGGVCTACAAPCRLCYNAINVCTACFLNSTMPVYYNQLCIASSSCPIGRYVNATNSSCESCPSTCTQCTSPTSCSLCATGYYLLGQTCISTCPNTTYPTFNSTVSFCQTCNGCSTCSSSTNCTSCTLSQFLYVGVCYSVCPNTTYSSGQICIGCPTNCPTCRNSSYCTSCVTSMNLYVGSCYSNCPNSTYANSTQQLCVACPASCTTCTNPSSCQSCATNYSMQLGVCVLHCAKGISYLQVCYPCGLNCANCNDTICIRCDTSYVLANNTCLSQCPSNMLTMDTINCVPCTDKFVNCSTCNNTHCLLCKYGQLTNGTCRPCDPGLYAESGTCTACPSACATCANLTFCYSCATNNYLFGSMCSSSCPRDMVPNGTLCSYCADKCSICNISSSLCSVCNAGVYLHNNLCLNECPSPLIVSYDFLTCVTEAVYYQQFSKASKIIPFPFTIGVAILIIICAGLRCYYKDMHLQTVLCGAVSLIESATWVIFVALEFIYWSNFHPESLYSLICGGVGLVLLILLNAIHLRFYYKYVETDSDFQRWAKRHGCTSTTLLVFSTTLTFKFYRFIHSKFLGRDQLSMQLSSPNRLVPFSLLSVISLFLCSAPVFTGCALALYNSISQDQQFFVALDTITVTGIMILLILMDLYHPSDYFIDEFETKNLKKRAYQEEEIKFEAGSQISALEENASNENLIPMEEDQGEMALPQSGNKLKSTFQKTVPKSAEKSTPFAKTKQGLGNLGSQTKIKAEEDELIEDESESQIESVIEQPKIKWKPKVYDHHGYLIKYDANNNPVKYDENGYRVEIDDKGVHHKYNAQGLEMKQIDGEHVPHDEQGFQLRNGKRYDDRGYEVREENGQLAFYQPHGFKVLGSGQNERLVDEEGNTVKIDQKGNIKRYQEDGHQIVDYKGQKLLKDSDGHFVRKNENGEWQKYDPSDGFLLKINKQTGEMQKFDELGFRVVYDKFGGLHRFDEDGNKVTVLPGNEIVKYDEQGYRIEKDSEGKVHRYDEDGYEVITDEKGNVKFIDKNGYSVQRDLYGRVSLFDEQGNEVVIDPVTGKHRRYNEQGLEITKDALGNIILKDKRGRTVKELEEGSYEKYDAEGNKLWLDENGYQLQQDADGNMNRYDKVGDRVQTSYDIDQEESEDQKFESTLLQETKKKKPLKYKYKPPQQPNYEEELDKLISINQPITFDDQDEEISELQEFHDYEEPIEEVEVDEQLNRIVNKERNELLFEEEKERGLEDLKDMAVVKNSCYDDIAEPPAEDFNELLMDIGDLGHESLVDKELNKQPEFDQELFIKDVREEGMMGSPDKAQEREGLADKQLHKQPEFDKEALVREMDEHEPDVLAIKQMEDEAAQIARQRALEHPLATPADQDRIEIRSVADASVAERSFDNQGVQPLENRSQYDELYSGEGIEVGLGRRRGGRSEVSLAGGKKDTQTVYNYNTVQVEIKNQNSLYDEDEQIESLHEQQWHEHLNPTLFTRQPVKENNDRHSNANTNILYLEEEGDQDALSDLVNRSASARQRQNPHHRYDILSGNAPSIEEFEEELFEQVNERGIRERREFKLSGAPNPLVEYAKTMEANKKTLQEKMYLQHPYKHR